MSQKYLINFNLNKFVPMKQQQHPICLHIQCDGFRSSHVQKESKSQRVDGKGYKIYTRLGITNLIYKINWLYI